jgi:DNA (cytosine-5)-methyltransferase 1
MKHLGDITKLNGAEIPFVDIITGGSPCQDLSIAGKRKGLAGERSGLFMDQMRLIKEQRNETKRLFDKGAIDSVRPRFMVWENVPGAFSSNKGEDFRCVLEETAKVVQGDARIPGPPNGKWPHSGCIMGDGWSIAWRLHDAQFWGVPQRRKRISLVADFAGGALQKYYLSARACQGILRRAEKRGKTLPPMLKAALEKQANQSY